MASPSSQLVWLITGTATGIGKELALAVLERGDKVIATARGRSLSKLDDLKAAGAATLELDVTAPLDDLKAVAEKAIKIYGKVDVIVNNAGYILVGALEENTPEESFDQFNTNFFGALNVTRAFLPHLRERRTGDILFIGSVGGYQSLPNGGLYTATKWALRAVAATLKVEVAPFNIRALCIDLGYFRTTFLADDHRKPYQSRIEDYRRMSEKANAALNAYNGKQPGDPKKGVRVIIDVVRGEGSAKGREYPEGLRLGSDCYAVAKRESEKVIKEADEWKEVSFSTDF